MLITGLAIGRAYDLQMAHSYVSSIFHVVFSTKERVPLNRRRSFEDEFLAMLQAANMHFEPDQVFG